MVNVRLENQFNVGHDVNAFPRARIFGAKHHEISIFRSVIPIPSPEEVEKVRI